MNKTALVTGATSGLGLEFVKLLAKDGYTLVLVARSEEKLKQLQASGLGVESVILVKDLSLPHAAKEVFAELVRQQIEVDVLINNAGFGLMGAFDELELDQQMEMIQLNIGALTELTRLVLPGMKKRNRGSILNVASMAAFLPGPLMAVYYASKAYVLSFSEALAEELAGSAVTVTTLCPGPTKTQFGAAANAEGSRLFKRAMSADQVARQGYAAMKTGKRVIITGTLNRLSIFGTKFIPRSAAAKFAKSLAKKN
ncbi:SDR family NAD(P)-dependent oxidoreductase [Gorillibacterium timonense]|uniref:SDR family NAD(P)-dependent oxidoreductase n=1 Tax=Gorillibacterium timonense TaxID=1689269 RepID=UPI00071C7DAC|nr:SDR family oxidoreductase [Gorillibacterium timonense]